MLSDKLIESFKGKLIVSCLGYEREQFSSPDIIKAVADSVVSGGAAAVIANGVDNINSVLQTVNVPVLGMNIRKYSNVDCCITASIKEVAELVELTRCDIIIADATDRQHPEGDKGVEFIREIKLRYPGVILMADVSSFDEGVKAYEAGADLLIASLSINSIAGNKPDFDLVNLLSKGVDIPVIAAGNIWDPQDAKEMLKKGAYAVVVGKAIVDPYAITKNFVKKLEEE